MSSTSCARPPSRTRTRTRIARGSVASRAGRCARRPTGSATWPFGTVPSGIGAGPERADTPDRERVGGGIPSDDVGACGTMVECARCSSPGMAWSTSEKMVANRALPGRVSGSPTCWTVRIRATGRTAVSSRTGSTTTRRSRSVRSRHGHDLSASGRSDGVDQGTCGGPSRAFEDRRTRRRDRSNRSRGGVWNAGSGRRRRRPSAPWRLSWQRMSREQSKMRQRGAIPGGVLA